MNYNLNEILKKKKGRKKSTLASFRHLLSMMVEEKRLLAYALIAIFFNSLLRLLSPLLIGYTIDHYVQTKQYHGVLVFSGILLSMYLITLVTGYLQTKLMGTVGQRMLYTLRNSVFTKLQELPVDFFNQNKAGDLISRINNDTDKLNQFFSQSLMQFMGSVFTMVGAGIFLLSINLPLGAASLAPAVLLYVFTYLLSPWVKRKNAESLKSTGFLSAEIQESLNNFRVIIAFNRRDYFRERFDEANRQNYTTAVKAGLANYIFMPVYTFFSNIGQLIVLAFGIYLISTGHFTVGFLISFLAYVNNFYNPLRQLAALWANLQVALAGWDRIARILSLKTNLKPVEEKVNKESNGELLTFKNVSFHYPNGKDVLHTINFSLGKGKTYAFVGPTGGGKTTTASLMARLYDPSVGNIYLDGKDLRSYTARERTAKIGFILQDPFLFTGNVRDNILYGNDFFRNHSNGELTRVLRETGLETLLERFDDGLETRVETSGDSISLGQKQLIAFMRAVLRRPELLILDEASANIDTVTEQLLDRILNKLPRSTTRVIIAHRLNTIENADEIYFVNSGELTRAGSLDEAVDMLLNRKRAS
ncbi:MAG TPA: ABC transporter ATP-binding protein [Bacteroidales bacterium]|nr:ABC transporter ATP-binding protein [Bacteroidales bacterium]